MSYDAVDQAIATRGPKGYAKWVLTLLAHHKNPITGKCCPSVTTLAEEAGIKRHTVINALKALEADGWITKATNTGRATSYTLELQPVPETAPVYQCRNRHYTSAENGTTPVPETAPEQVSNKQRTNNPPTPRGGAGGKKIPTGYSRSTVHRTETGSESARRLIKELNTRDIPMEWDLTDRSWAEMD